MTFKEATDLLAMPLEEVAAAIGRSYATTVAYRAGTREPPPEAMEALAELMRSQSAELAKAADRLRRD